MCDNGRPISPGISLNRWVTLGVKRRNFKSLSRNIVAISVLLSRLAMSLRTQDRASTLDCNSALTVCNSSFMDCISSLEVVNSSLVDCSSSLVDCSSSLVDLSSSTDVCISSCDTCKASRNSCNSLACAFSAEALVRRVFAATGGVAISLNTTSTLPRKRSGFSMPCTVTSTRCVLPLLSSFTPLS